MMIYNIQLFIPQKIPLESIMFASIVVVSAELKGFLPRQTIENTEKVIHLLLCLQVKS